MSMFLLRIRKEFVDWPGSKCHFPSFSMGVQKLSRYLFAFCLGLSLIIPAHDIYAFPESGRPSPIACAVVFGRLAWDDIAALVEHRVKDHRYLPTRPSIVKVGGSLKDTGRAIVVPENWQPDIVNRWGRRIPIQLGMRQLFLDELYDQQRIAVTNRARELQETWKKASGKALHREAELSLLPQRKPWWVGGWFRSREPVQLVRDQQGIYQTPFLSKYCDVAAELVASGRKFKKRRFSELSIEEQTEAVAESVKLGLHRSSDEALTRFNQLLKDRWNSAKKDTLDGWVAKPHLVPVETALLPLLKEVYKDYARQLHSLYRLPRASSKEAREQKDEVARLMRLEGTDLPDLWRIDPNLVVSDKGKITLALPGQHAVALYDLAVASVLLQSEKGLAYNPNGIILSLEHGATTLASNAASWLQLIQVFHNNGLKAAAYDLPHSMGPYTISFDRVVGPADVVAYQQMLNRRLIHLAQNPKAPFVKMGRSFGSTTDFAEAFATHLLDQKSPVDAYVLTSLANPDTAEAQIKNMMDYVSSGQVKGEPIPGSFAYFKVFSHLLVQELDTARALFPERMLYFGDNVFLLQGEADIDGASREPGQPNVVQALEGFVRRYSPLAHIYVFDDPLKSHPEVKARFDQDHGIEASHFLVSSRGDMKPKGSKGVPSDIPPELLPQQGSQTKEVLAFTFASMDYIIDFSPSTKPERRAELTKLRSDFTGLDGNYGYFRWYLAKLAKDKKNDDLSDFNTLISGAVSPGRENLNHRLARVLLFMEAEKRRVRQILGPAEH